MQKKYCLIILIIFFGLPGFGQTKDAQLWTSVNFDKKLNNMFSLSVSEELRFTDNISEIGTFFTDLGIAFKLNKNWRLSGNYRFTNKQRLDDSYSKRHRYYFDLVYRNKFEKLTLSLRTRFQAQYADVNSSATGQVPEYYSRNKMSLKYDLNKKYTPYAAAEIFLPLNGGKGIYIDNVRYSAGLEYSFNKISSLDIFYMIQQEYNKANPETDFVIGLGFNHSF